MSLLGALDLVAGLIMPPPPGRRGRDDRRGISRGAFSGLIDTISVMLLRGIGILKTATIWFLVLQVILITACGIYALLYWLCMPAMITDTPLHFDYGMRGLKHELSRAPAADIDFLAQHTQWNATNLTATHVVADKLLRAGQQYVVGVELELPESPTNVRVGVFMVYVSLMDRDGRLLGSSGRPTFLPHTSEGLRAIRLLLMWPLLLVGAAFEADCVRVESFDFFQESDKHPLAKATVVLSSPDVQIYEARLFISPQLHGLRHYMHHWFWTAAAFGVAFVTSLELTVLGFLYAFYSVMQDDGGGAEIFEEPEGAGRRDGHGHAHGECRRGGYRDGRDDDGGGYGSAYGNGSVEERWRRQQQEQQERWRFKASERGRGGESLLSVRGQEGSDERGKAGAGGSGDSARRKEEAAISIDSQSGGGASGGGGDTGEAWRNGELAVVEDSGSGAAFDVGTYGTDVSRLPPPPGRRGSGHARVDESKDEPWGGRESPGRARRGGGTWGSDGCGSSGGGDVNCTYGRGGGREALLTSGGSYTFDDDEGLRRRSHRNGGGDGGADCGSGGHMPSNG